MTPPARPVFVVGCPRSGTSPFARWLDACGLSTVDDPRRAERYPSGYYEHVPILMFHKAMERTSRGADHAITAEPFLRSEQLEDPFVRRVYELAFEPVLNGKVDFVKFPQLALSVDFLFDQFPEAHVIAIWRDPSVTFRSLVRREFPREMIPASGVKAVLLWNIYAHHVVAAKRAHPDRVTVVEIDRFLADPRAGSRLLERIGRDPSEAVPVGTAIDAALWKREVPIAWRIYHGAMRRLCLAMRGRLGPDRAMLADERRWEEALRSVSAGPGASQGARTPA